VSTLETGPLAFLDLLVVTMLQNAVLLVGLSVLVSGLSDAAVTWDLARATAVDQAIANWSPATTAAPELGIRHIFARESIVANAPATCGFLSGLYGKLARSTMCQ
jgi:hypothetical protein